MEPKSIKIISIMILAGAFFLGLILLSGCEETEPAQTTPTTETSQEMAMPAETTETSTPVIAALTEQTMCPVMEGSINTDIFVEYMGKKVYFCCSGCETMFLQEPEKYISKLPQFQD